jgi:hypothetical protein
MTRNGRGSSEPRPFSFGARHTALARLSALPVTREKLKSLLAEYGNVALATYFAIFLLTLAGFYIAISLGFKTEGTASGLGVLGAAYVATKLTTPLRIAGTLLATPLVAAVVRKVRGEPKAQTPSNG